MSEYNDSSSNLPDLSFENLEKEDLSTILTKYEQTINICHLYINGSNKIKGLIYLTKLLDACLFKLSQTLPDEGHLSTAIKIFELANMCLQKLDGENNIFSLQQDDMLLHYLINLVLKSYHYCKESEVLHKGDFSRLSSTIKTLFQKTFALQSSCILHINKTTVEKCDNQIMKRLLTKVHELTQVATQIDDTLVASSWKLLMLTLRKFLKTDSYGLVEEVYLYDLMKLFIESFKNFHSIYINKKNDLSLKPSLAILKISIFYLNQIKFLLQEINLDAILKTDLYKFIHEIAQIFFSICKTTCKETSQLEAVTTLLTSFDQLLSVAVKRSYLTIASFSAATKSNEEALIRIFITLRIIRSFKYLSQDSLLLINSWKNDNFTIFHLIFTEIPKISCDLLFLIELYGFDENFSKKVFLFDKIIPYLSSCVVHLPLSSFTNFEVLLLQQSLDDQNPLCQLLAHDLWCFVARLSTPEVCYQHASTILQIILASKFHRRLKLYPLLRRLYEFLPVIYQQKLRTIWYSTLDGTKENPDFTLVRCFGLNVLVSDEKSNLKDQIVNLYSFISIQLFSFSEKQKNNFCFSLVVNFILDVYVINEELMTNLEIVELLSKNDMNCALRSVWSWCFEAYMDIKPSDFTSSQFADFICNLLLLMSSLLFNKHFQPIDDVIQMIHKLLKDFSSFTTTKSPAVYGFIYFLTSLQMLDLPSDLQGNIGNLWKLCLELSQSHWYLSHEALEQLEKFSRFTQNPEVISDICQTNKFANQMKAHLKNVTTISIKFNLPAQSVVNKVVLDDSQELSVTSLPKNAPKILEERFNEMRRSGQNRLLSNVQLELSQNIQFLTYMIDNYSSDQFNTSVVDHLNVTLDKVKSWLS